MILHLRSKSGMVIVVGARPRNLGGALWGGSACGIRFTIRLASVLSTVAAAIPVVTLLVLIATGAVKTHLAAVIALL